MILDNIFQKLKWNKLARDDAKFYVWSAEKNPQESVFQESGRADVNQFVLEDALLQGVRGGICLEIGCGVGRMTQFLVENFSKVYGIDIAEKMIEQARVRLGDAKNIEFFATDGIQIPLPDNSVDLCFSFIVFQHFPSKAMVRKNLQEIKRVLKSGGISKIQFRGLPILGFSKFFKWFYGVYFTEGESLQLLEDLGFEILRISNVGTKYMWATFKKR